MVRGRDRRRLDVPGAPRAFLRGPFQGPAEQDTGPRETVSELIKCESRQSGRARMRQSRQSGRARMSAGKPAFEVEQKATAAGGVKGVDVGVQ